MDNRGRVCHPTNHPTSDPRTEFRRAEHLVAPCQMAIEVCTQSALSMIQTAWIRLSAACGASTASARRKSEAQARVVHPAATRGGNPRQRRPRTLNTIQSQRSIHSQRSSRCWTPVRQHLESRPAAVDATARIVKWGVGVAALTAGPRQTALPPPLSEAASPSEAASASRAASPSRGASASEAASARRRAQVKR